MTPKRLLFQKKLGSSSNFFNNYNVKNAGTLSTSLFCKIVVALKRAVGDFGLASEAVQRAPLSFQGIHHVHSSDGFPLGMLAVGHSISDDIFQEDLENTSRFLVDEARDSFDTSSACQATNGWFSDTLDVIT